MGTSLARILRNGWPVLAGALVGLVAGAIWTLAQPDRYRADVRVLLRGSAVGQLLPAVKALAESSLLEQNVAQTLHISHPPQVSAKPGDGGILTVSVEGGSRDRARQIDAEVVVVLSQKVAQRLGSTGVNATVLDPAHAAEQTSPTPARNLLIAGLIGLAGGVAAAAAGTRRLRGPISGGSVDPKVERRLRARLAEVAKRERALAKRAGELAVRERDFELRADERERRARQLESELTDKLQAATARAEPEPAAAVLPESAAEVSEGREGARAPEPGGWNIEAIAEITRKQVNADPTRYEELNAYLFLLREHADAAGRLPRQFDSLIEEVFLDTPHGPLS